MHRFFHLYYTKNCYKLIEKKGVTQKLLFHRNQFY
nr:MAG TPA: hypothetical protein [Caudoviricetes sp.]